MEEVTVDHFYHVYADGEWREPVSEHLLALKQSGLEDNLAVMCVGYVGGGDRISEAENFINDHIKTVTVAKSPGGWEQETMRLMPQMIGSNPVLYAHTKGAWSTTPINRAWRRSMTKECVINWRHCLTVLGEYDIAGCHWLQDENDKKWFYGGTFWWANPDYIRTLPPVGEGNRFMAEHWIGLNPDVKAFDLKPGHPGEIPLDTDWRT